MPLCERGDLDGMSQGQPKFFKTEKEMHALATYLLHTSPKTCHFDKH